MIKHHPDTNILAEYSSGSLDWAVSICVSAHIQMCAQCRQEIAKLNSIGGCLVEEFSEQEQVQNKPTGSFNSDEHVNFSSLMTRIKAHEQRQNEQSNPAVSCAKDDPMLRNLPKVVNKLLPQGGIRWTTISRSLKTTRLRAGQDKFEVAFHRISSGGKVAEHDHTGHEYTLVLNGSFSDADGVYTPGDFLLKKPGDVHRPTATQNQDCLCLSVVEAPVALTGWAGKLINPFLSIRPQ